MKVFQTGLDRFYADPDRKVVFEMLNSRHLCWTVKSNMKCELHKIKTVFDIMLTSVLVLR